MDAWLGSLLFHARRILFHPSVLVARFVAALTNHAWSSSVYGITVGGRPTVEHRRTHKLIVNLCDETADPCADARYPLSVYTQPLLLVKAAAERCHAAVQQGETVYAYCCDGGVRSTTVLAAYLMLHCDHTLEEAVKTAAAARGVQPSRNVLHHLQLEALSAVTPWRRMVLNLTKKDCTSADDENGSGSEDDIDADSVTTVEEVCVVAPPSKSSHCVMS